MKDKKYYFQFAPWHFIVIIVAFYFSTTIIADKEMKNIPIVEKTKYISSITDISILDGINFVFFYDEDSDLSQKMRFNLDLLAQKEDSKANFFEVNLAHHPEYYHQYKISGTPNILVFKDNEELFRIMGMVPSNNLEMIYSRILK